MSRNFASGLPFLTPMAGCRFLAQLPPFQAGWVRSGRRSGAGRLAMRGHPAGATPIPGRRAGRWLAGAAPGILIAAMVAAPASAGAWPLKPDGAAYTDGPVSSLLVRGGRLFAGGAFRNAGGTAYGAAVAVDPRTGAPAGGGLAVGYAGPPPAGSSRQPARVVGAAPDGEGGALVWGVFERAGGFARAGLVKIRPGGSVDPGFVPPVRTGIFYAGTAAWIAGRAWVQVTYEGGRERFGAEVLDASGRMISTIDDVGWLAAEPGGTEVYVWNRLGTKLTVYDAATAVPLRTLTGVAIRSAIAGGVAYATHGGSENGAVATDLSTGRRLWSATLPFEPGATAIGNGRLFVAGHTPWSRAPGGAPIVSLDLATGALDSAFAPRLDIQPVYGGPAIAFAGGRLVVSGPIRGGPRRDWLVALDPATGATDDRFQAGAVAPPMLAGLGDRVLVFGYGDDQVLGAEPRPGLAAFDRRTGALDAHFRPELAPLSGSLAVDALLPAPGGILAGGSLAAPGGSQGLTALRIDDGGPLPVQPAATNGPVAAILRTSRRIYVAGAFSAAGGRSRPGLAALTARGTLDRRFLPPRFDGPITALALAGGRLAVGGSFTRAGPLRRAGLTAVSLTTGAPSARFNASLPRFQYGPGRATVTALLSAAGRLYVGGLFTNPWILGNVAGGVRAISTSSGQPIRRFAADYFFYGDEEFVVPQSLARSAARLYVASAGLYPPGVAVLTLATGRRVALLTDISATAVLATPDRVYAAEGAAIRIFRGAP